MSQIPNNPYGRAGTGPVGPRRKYVKRPQPAGVLLAPAITLAVVGGIDLLHAMFSVVKNLFFYDPSPPKLRGRHTEEFRQLADFMVENGQMVNLVVGVVFILFSSLVLFGAVMATMRKGYGLAITSAIIAIVPCTGVMDCCLIEIGVGIWFVTVLMQAKVKAMF